MAILEALSCGLPVLAREAKGGMNELIRHKENGYIYKDEKDLNEYLSYVSTSDFAEMSEKTHKDFMERLHIKYALKQYKETICQDQG